MRREKLKKKVVLLLLLILLVPRKLYADIGPKPSLDILVKGIASEDYYLDLLVNQDNVTDYFDTSIYRDIDRLKSYKDKEGYHPALAVGSKVPVFGKLTYEEKLKDGYLHSFSYLGVPSEFKIVILTVDNKLIVSDKVERKLFNSKMEFDLTKENVGQDILESAGEVKEIFPISYIIKNTLIRIVICLFIEILIAFIFRFRKLSSYKLIFKINILTQILLNLGIQGTSLFYGSLASISIYIILEIFILIFECKYYINNISEHSKKRRLIYAILANIISFLAGFKISI